jgi:hypothetical protein
MHVQLLYKQKAIISPQVTPLTSHNRDAATHNLHDAPVWTLYLPYCLSLSNTASIVPACTDRISHTTRECYQLLLSRIRILLSFIILIFHFFMCRQTDCSSINMSDMPRKLKAGRRGEAVKK